MPLTEPVILPRSRAVLRGRETLSAPDVESANAVIADLFCDHRLAPLGGDPVRLSLRSAHAGPVGLDLLDYDGAVRISPVALETFHLVQIPLQGRATMQVGSTEVESSSQRATVPPLDHDFALRWDTRTPHLIVYFDRAELVRVAAAMYGDDAASGLRLSLSMALDDTRGQAFLRTALDLHDMMEQPDRGGAYAGRLAAELLMSRMLAAVPNSADRSTHSLPAKHSGSPFAESVLRRFLALIEERISENVTVLDLAAMLAVPIRTLQMHVADAAGCTPSDLLRDARLRRAHLLLVDADPAHDTVTAIVHRCGFSNPGRFAGLYRARFGESPAQTLHR